MQNLSGLLNDKNLFFGVHLTAAGVVNVVDVA